MTMLITDPHLIDRIKAERAESGSDQRDEVWDGVYVVPPLAGNDHQRLVSLLTGMLLGVVNAARLGEVFPGVNVSDRDDDWKHNYREPDMAVFLHGTSAVDRGAYWLGGPDFAVEILSEGDRAREKLDFYAKVNVRELLIVDRDPWRLELYRLSRRKLGLAGTSGPKSGEPLTSKVLPLTFRLVADRPRPTIEVVHRDGRRWEI